MPITFAHPAAILPVARLRRESGWLGGLVAGSVAPDACQALLGKFDRFPHSLPGLVLLDVPAALLLAWLAHVAIGKRLRRMPGLESIHPHSAFSWRWCLVACFAGTASHLVLDLFTHPESPLASRGILAIPLGGPVWRPFTVAILLWFATSAAGTAAIAAWLVHRARRVPGGWRRFLSWRWFALGTAVAIPLPRIAWRVRASYTPDSFEFLHRMNFLADEVRWTLLASFVLGLVVFHLVTMEPGLTPAPPSFPAGRD